MEIELSGASVIEGTGRSVTCYNFRSAEAGECVCGGSPEAGGLKQFFFFFF